MHLIDQKQHVSTISITKFTHIIYYVFHCRATTISGRAGSPQHLANQQSTSNEYNNTLNLLVDDVLLSAHSNNYLIKLIPTE